MKPIDTTIESPMNFTLKTIKLNCVLAVIFILTINIQGFSIDPAKDYILTPDSVDWEYQELKVETSDGFKLNTWIYSPSPENNKNTVLILAYPDAGNMSYFVYNAWVLAYYGFTVVTFDYRGFGKSTPFSIQKDILYLTEFSTDLVAIVNMTKEQFPLSKIGVWALSMGTTITTISINNIKDDIDFIIGDGYVTDTTVIINRIKSQKNKVVNLPEEKQDYFSYVKQIKVPLLIFAASNDTITTYQDALELKELLGKTCSVIEYKGEHLRAFMAWDKPFMRGYIEHINVFIKDYL